MKHLSIVALAVLGAAFAGCQTTEVSVNDSTRDYAYEAYCDSIWDNDPDYYLDVLAESDEYCNYIEEHGKWFAK